MPVLVSFFLVPQAKFVKNSQLCALKIIKIEPGEFVKSTSVMLDVAIGMVH